jgi:arsenate reductase
MTKLLFLCTGNSCRSQIAEGWTRALKPDQYEAYSAGTKSHGLDPNAVRVMQEASVDISGHQSTSVDQLGPIEFDIVVTVCGHADENCPVFIGAPRVVHVPFEDPPKLAAKETDEQKAVDHYRRVRDEIRDFVAGLPESLDSQASTEPPEN